MAKPTIKPLVKPTGAQLTRWLMAERYQRSFVLPHYTPAGWWECDVFELTAAGYFREYEIKVTRADFKRDAEKMRDDGWWRGQVGRHKHRELALADSRGPANFWFVTPAGLLDPSEVPEFAGLIEFDGRREREIKKSPRLHGQRTPASIEQHARGICYWRLHGVWQQLSACGPDPEYLI